MTNTRAELREAAMRIRGLNASATPGICPDWTYNAVRHIARNCQIECSHDEHQGHDQPEWDRYEDAPYITLMQNPDLGNALADWLDEAARYAALYADLHTASTGAAPAAADHDTLTRHALAVARQILGTEVRTR
ncbi:hypothetical protein OH809_45515 (plasmid) [Streptomyces sp. NBC_00873]|uniref:hypothetical protein n=1 Tax=Streptomyces sp. NBC_00873 TaxID=2975852 RepID=UPI0037DD52F3|nr:hypothetical protein OH809_45515 [Streptomyces sp. NBC_00873]